MKTFLVAVGMICVAGLASAQPKKAPASPDETASVTVAGKAITIKYAAPSVRGRQIFGDGGLISSDKHYPIWRAGANSATALHTEATLSIGGMTVLPGDYTMFVDVADPEHWKLVISKKTGEWGLDYPGPGEDVGRVPMKMSKPGAVVEQLKWDLTAKKITLSWEHHVASVDYKAK